MDVECRLYEAVKSPVELLLLAEKRSTLSGEPPFVVESETDVSVTAVT